MSTLSDKIRRLEDASEDLDTILSILKGEFDYSQLRGDKTINEMIGAYINDGNRLTQIINDIIREHRSEECPHR